MFFNVRTAGLDLNTVYPGDSATGVNSKTGHCVKICTVCKFRSPNAGLDVDGTTVALWALAVGPDILWLM